MAARLKPENFIDKVEAALRSSFPRATIELELDDARNVTGEIAWSGFSPTDSQFNQRKLLKVLREKLGGEADRAIMLFTLTPTQKRLMDESRLDEEESILSTAKSILQERRKKARSKTSNGTNGHPAPKKRKLTTHG